MQRKRLIVLSLTTAGPKISFAQSLAVTEAVMGNALWRLWSPESVTILTQNLDQFLEGRSRGL